MPDHSERYKSGEWFIPCSRQTAKSPNIWADIFTLSPRKEWVGKDDAEQTKAFLRTLFPEDAMLHIFRSDKPAIGRLGRNLMPCRDWVAKLDAGASIDGDVIVPNPFTGAAGTTTDGRESFIAQSCLASFPYLVIEFDNMPLATQCAFWCSFIEKSKLAPKLASIVYSGGKSLHGLLRIGAVTLQDWSVARDRISALFASDSDRLFRADIQAMRPRTGTRLPGVQRCGNGELQRLLYLNPAAVGRIPPAIAPDAPETASGASGVAGKAETALCEETRPAGVPAQSGEADNLPYHCADCFAIEKCKLGYGKFWQQKSDGGVGCYCRRWKEPDNCKRP